LSSFHPFYFSFLPSYFLSLFVTSMRIELLYSINEDVKNI
jgi:hypothetical protein